MGLDVICSNQKWMGVLDGWRQTDLQDNKKVKDCETDAADKGYKRQGFSWIMSDGRHLDCGYEKDIPDETCEAKVKHYGKNLANHIYKDSGLPPIQQEYYYPHHDTILDQCHSISENLRNTDRRDDFIKWSGRKDHLRRFSEQGAYEKAKLDEISKTHPEAGAALSTLYEKHQVNLFEGSVDKHRYDAKKSGIEAECAEFIRNENSRANFKIAKAVVLVFAAIAIIGIAAKVYYDKQKEKEKQKNLEPKKV